MLASGVSREAMSWSEFASDEFRDDPLVCRAAETIGRIGGHDLRLLCTLRHLSEQSGLAPVELAYCVGALCGARFLRPIVSVELREDAPNGWRLVVP
jgi:hypothetical protein